MEVDIKPLFNTTNESEAINPASNRAEKELDLFANSNTAATINPSNPEKKVSVKYQLMAAPIKKC
jgi:hypothetical protein